VNGVVLDALHGAFRAKDGFVINPKDPRRWDDGWAVDMGRFNDKAPIGERYYFEPVVKKHQGRVCDGDDPKQRNKKIRSVLRSVSAPDVAAVPDVLGDLTVAPVDPALAPLEPALEPALEAPGALETVPEVPASTPKPKQDPRKPRPPGQVRMHKGYKVRPPQHVRWFSVVDGPEERPGWNDRWWKSHSLQNHLEPRGMRDYFGRRRRFPCDIPPWPEPSQDRYVVANWSNDGPGLTPNWGERERARLNAMPPKPEPEFDLGKPCHDDVLIDGMRSYFVRYLPLYSHSVVRSAAPRPDEKGDLLIPKKLKKKMLACAKGQPPHVLQGSD